MALAAHAVLTLRGDGVVELGAGLTQTAVLAHGLVVAVNGYVLEVLHILLRGEDLFELIEIVTAGLLLQLAARLLSGLDRIHSGALLGGELDSGERIHPCLAHLAGGTLALAVGRAVAAGSLALALLLALALRLSGGRKGGDAHSCEENEMFHNSYFLRFSSFQTPLNPQSLIAPAPLSILND